MAVLEQCWKHLYKYTLLYVYCMCTSYCNVYCMCFMFCACSGVVYCNVTLCHHHGLPRVQVTHISTAKLTCTPCKGGSYLVATNQGMDVCILLLGILCIMCTSQGWQKHFRSGQTITIFISSFHLQCQVSRTLSRNTL